MKNIFSRKLLSLLLCMVLIEATALTFTSCGNEGKTDDTTVSETTAAPDKETEKPQSNVLGEGNTSFSFVVRDIDGSEKSFTVKTDAKTVGEALLAVDMIEGEDGQYGLYVKKVNGITADFDVDATYWAFYINGEYAMTGVDTTDIVAGATYMLAKQK
ncbi:MAG: DUF4430 domain-containing protein [Clostridia bacterium]|nr:DUF4430 domain-containing protein [Clostridia bacterium]